MTANGLAAVAREIRCFAAVFPRVADAVAALSCEAARWDAAAFDAPASGCNTKDEADVAACLKTLLKESKLVGSREAGGASTDSFANVPTVNRNFSQAVRALDAQVRIDLDPGQGKEFVLMLLATQFVSSAHFMCKMSVDRARFCAGSIADAELREELIAGGIDVGDLEGAVGEVMTDSGAVPVLQRVYEHLFKLGDCLAWKAVVAMAVIEIDSSIEKPQASVETDNEAGLQLVGDLDNDMQEGHKLGADPGFDDELLSC